MAARAAWRDADRQHGEGDDRRPRFAPTPLVLASNASRIPHTGATVPMRPAKVTVRIG